MAGGMVEGMVGGHEARLASLGIKLPEPMGAKGKYAPWTRAGNMVIVAGEGAFWRGEILHNGRFGEGLSLDEGIAMGTSVEIDGIFEIAF